jgi:hypothetical protein
MLPTVVLLVVSLCPAQSPSDPLLLAQADQAFAVRDQPGKLAAVAAALDEAELRSPDDYDVLWRQARLLVWEGEGKPTDREKSALGQRAWSYGEKAAAICPDRVEGHYFAALALGQHALGIGLLTALSRGVEGKFKQHLEKATSLDERFQHGNLHAAWGRFYASLPWPKRDEARSEQHLSRARELFPDNLRARLTLAQLEAKRGNAAEAEVLLASCLSAKPGAYDAPEELRVQQRAREELSKLNGAAR